MRIQRLHFFGRSKTSLLLVEWWLDFDENLDGLIKDGFDFGLLVQPCKNTSVSSDTESIDLLDILWADFCLSQWCKGIIAQYFK